MDYHDDMSEHEITTAEADLASLQALQAEASELSRVEDLIDHFNIFEAIGFVDQELMHSRFLAYLLDTRQGHGLGDTLLRKLLDRASVPVSLDLRDGGLGQTLVHREWRNVDILLTNETHRFAVIIENKIWSSEHSDQLDRYFQIVKKDYPGWRVFGFYLTPFGDKPSHEAYSPLSYGTVCEVLEDILKHQGSALSPDVKMSVEHYARMVKRRILGDPETVRLCQQMYRKHKRAFDLIFEHRPDHQMSNRDILFNLVSNEESLVLTGKSKGFVWFHPREWEVPGLQGNTDRNGFLRFVFHNRPDGIDLFLETSPGDEATRRKLFEMGQKNEMLFNYLVDPDTDRWPKLYRRTLLTPSLSEDVSDHEREQEIRGQWAGFLEEDLPRIEAALKEEAWIWGSIESEDSA